MARRRTIAQSRRTRARRKRNFEAAKRGDFDPGGFSIIHYTYQGRRIRDRVLTKNAERDLVFHRQVDPGAYATKVARENPLSSGETAALVLGGVAVVGALAYAFWPKAAAAGASPAAARTSGALDTYSSTLIPPTGLLIGNIAPSNFVVSGVNVLSITGAGTASATITMTAPPGTSAAVSAALSATAISYGYTTGPVVDTGVYVQ